MSDNIDEISFCDDFVLDCMEENWKEAMQEIRKIKNKAILDALDDIPTLIADVRAMRKAILNNK